jgi:hypothetical protein
MFTFHNDNDCISTGEIKRQGTMSFSSSYRDKSSTNLVVTEANGLQLSQ